MTTRIISGRVSEIQIGAEGIISAKIFDEDPSIYNSHAIGELVDRMGYPNSVLSVAGSTALRLMDIATLRDADDGAGFYAAMRGMLPSSWSTALLLKSYDETAEFSEILIDDDPAVIGFNLAYTPEIKLIDGPTSVLDYDSRLDVELLPGGSLESMSADDMLRGEVGYLVGNEILLNAAVQQLSATRWRLLGPMVRGWKGTEWAIAHGGGQERFVRLDIASTKRVNDTLADLDKLAFFKAVTSGQSLDSAAITRFTDTGVSLKPWSPADVSASFDMSDNVVIIWRRRSRLVGRNGRDFYDPPLGEESESYEIDILSDDETAVKRTLTSTTATVNYSDTDQTTDFGGLKSENLHVNIYQMSAAVGRGYAGHAILNPGGSSITAFSLLFQDHNIMHFEDDTAAEVQH
jgi:hypothetical protein